jgi:hypothetical protein
LQITTLKNSQAKQDNNSPLASVVNNNAIIPSRGRILTITGGPYKKLLSNSKFNFNGRPIQENKMALFTNHIFRIRPLVERLPTYGCNGN